MEILFTIIIPVYNVEGYIKECLDSVLVTVADSKDVEIIIVDDGSTDATGNIADEYALRNNLIRVIHQKNLGASCARNIAIDQSKGVYCLFYDGDDIVLPEALPSVRECIAESAKQGKQPDMVVSKYEEIMPPGKVFKRLTRDFNAVSDLPVPKMYETLGYYTAPWLFCIRMELMKQNNILFEPGLFRENADEWAPRIFLMAKTVILNSAYVYRHRNVREGSIRYIAKKEDAFYAMRTVSLQWRKFHSGGYSADALEVAEKYMRMRYLKTVKEQEKL